MTTTATNGTAKLTRDSIRAKVFNTKPQSELITIFGVEVEIRQPSLRVILDAQSSEDKTYAMANMMISYCFVPGTNEKVFEVADIDGILELPFGEDVSKINEIIAKLTSIDITGEEKNLEESRGSSTSSP